MTFSETLFQKLAEARQLGGGQLNKEQWLKIAQEVHENCQPAKKLLSARRSVRSTGIGLSDEQWIESLKENPAYQGIDVVREVFKCRSWATEKTRKEPSRLRILNWLNRAEKPVSMAPQNQVLRVVPEPPAGWQDRFQENFPEAKDYHGRSWIGLPSHVKAVIASMR